MGIFAAQAYPSSTLAHIEPPAFLAVPHSTNSHIWLLRFIGSDPKNEHLADQFHSTSPSITSVLPPYNLGLIHISDVEISCT